MKQRRTPCRASDGALTADDEGDGDFRLAELVAHDDAVVAAVGSLSVEDRQRRVMWLTDLCPQLRLEPLALLNQNAFSIPCNLQTNDP